MYPSGCALSSAPHAVTNKQSDWYVAQAPFCRKGLQSLVAKRGAACGGGTEPLLIPSTPAVSNATTVEAYRGTKGGGGRASFLRAICKGGGGVWVGGSSAGWLGLKLWAPTPLIIPRVSWVGLLPHLLSLVTGALSGCLLVPFSALSLCRWQVCRWQVFRWRTFFLITS